MPPRRKRLSLPPFNPYMMDEMKEPSMRRLGLSICLMLATSPAAAAPDWRQAREYDLLLSSFDIQPAKIRFKAGDPVRLRLINNTGTAHRVTAKTLFKSAEVRPRDASAVAKGDITVGSGETREILIVPAPGRYTLRSRNLLYRLMGMSAEIIVE
jgi:plastocyanin